MGFNIDQNWVSRIFLLVIFCCGVSHVQAVELKDKRFISLQKQINEFESQRKVYQALEDELQLEEKVFERFHASIVKLKNNPSFISNMKLSNQYQSFEQQSKALQKLRNQKSLALKKVEFLREQLLLGVDEEIQKLKSEKMVSSASGNEVTQLKIMTRIYDQYAGLKLKATPVAQPVNIPSELDDEKIVALKDILAGLDKKIMDVNRNLKHVRRKQFVQSSMIDTLSEESFFSEGQFIHSGEQNTPVNEGEVSALKANPGVSEGENNPIPDIPVDDNNMVDLDANSVSISQRSIDGIEAKRNLKGPLNLDEESFDENTEDLEKELIFLQAERLKIIHELQKQ